MDLGAGISSPFLKRLSILVGLTLAALVLLVTSAAGTAPVQASSDLDSEELAFLALINEYRVANGLEPLTLNDKLTAAASWMAADMAANNYFSHTDSLGRDPFQRMADFGYTYNTWKGENLAAGIATAQEAFDLWKGSPGHNSNMLNPHFRVIGIARVYGEDTVYGWYWATEFGGQGDPPPPPAPTPTPTPPPPPPTPTPPPPPPTPTPSPPPPPTPTATPEPPAPEPTPTPSGRRAEAPAPAPTEPPAPTPTPTVPPPEDAGLKPPPPSWRTIVSRVVPWWQRLGFFGAGDSLLAVAMRTVERYLELWDRLYVGVEDSQERVEAGLAVSRLEGGWLASFKS